MRLTDREAIVPNPRWNKVAVGRVALMFDMRSSSDYKKYWKVQDTKGRAELKRIEFDTSKGKHTYRTCPICGMGIDDLYYGMYFDDKKQEWHFGANVGIYKKCVLCGSETEGAA